MADKDKNQGAFAAAAILAQQKNRALEQVRTQYANDKFHDFNIVKEDALQRRAEFRAKKEHDAQLALEESINKLASEAADLKKAGKLDASKSKQNEISGLRRQGIGEDAFDSDELTRNFSSTLDEVIEDFGQASRDEMKVSIKRMTALMDTIELSGATEKDFLLEQYKATQDAMQQEYNKRANIAAAAIEKASEMSEQYLDISSLYAGFVDHNPVMMTLFRLGSDFIKRNRVNKKAQKDALMRDKKNEAFAEKQNKENALRAEIEQARDDQINARREETIELEREVAKKNKKNSETKKKEVEQKVIERQEQGETSFDFPDDEFSDTGDKPLTQDFMASLFGEVDEDGDPTGFTREDSGANLDIDDSVPVRVEQVDNPNVMRRIDEPTEMVKIDDSTPIMVQQDEQSSEEKAQSMFIRQDAERQERLNSEFQSEKIHRDEQMFQKLVDIEDAILLTNKITKQNGKSLNKLDGGNGLLEMLGLSKVGQILKGPVLKALMMFTPIVGALGMLLSKLGLGGMADKLTGGFDNLTGRNKGGKVGGKGKAGRGMFGRIASGGKNLLAGSGKMLARGGSMVARGGGALLGGASASVLASGAAGYGAGTLINDHVLSDGQKEVISDNLGAGVDNILSFFGNDEAKNRLDVNKRAESGTLFDMPDKATPDMPKMEAANEDVFKKESSGNKLIIKTDSINSNKVINNRSNAQQIEVPVQKKNQQKLEMLEEKVMALSEAEAKAKSIALSPPSMAPAPTKRKVIKSEAQSNPIQGDRSARNPDSSIQRLTDRFVSMGAA